MSVFEQVLMGAAIMSSAMAAGAFFDFSTFAIRGLRKLSPSEGARAMQKINEEAPSPLFMLLVFGTAVLCIGVGIHASVTLAGTNLVLRLVGAAVYVLGVAVLTIVYHVPRNDRLAALEATSPEGVSYWSQYLSEWVSLNHVRTIAPLITAFLFLLSLGR